MLNFLTGSFYGHSCRVPHIFPPVFSGVGSFQEQCLSVCCFAKWWSSSLNFEIFTPVIFHYYFCSLLKVGWCFSLIFNVIHGLLMSVVIGDKEVFEFMRALGMGLLPNFQFGYINFFVFSLCVCQLLLLLLLLLFSSFTLANINIYNKIYITVAT